MWRLYLPLGKPEELVLFKSRAFKKNGVIGIIDHKSIFITKSARGVDIALQS